MIQENLLNKKIKKYISLQEATKYCNYSQEYLSLRARQGKLKALKLGRNWMTTKEWLDEYLGGAKEIISLQEATKYCNYSQEYLALRARQGKLEAVKFGRNWVTKKEWLDEYLEKVKPSKDLSLEPFLPINVFQPQFVMAVALLIVFLFAGIFFNKENFKIVIDNISDSSQLQLAEIDRGSGAILSQLAEIDRRSGAILKDYFSWLGGRYFAANDFLERKISQAYKTFARFWQKPLKTPTREGLVVIPSTEKDEEVKKKIKESFSDEVRVEPEDESSGIIIPVFREREGDEYLYILVPVKN